MDPLFAAFRSTANLDACHVLVIEGHAARIVGQVHRAPGESFDHVAAATLIARHFSEGGEAAPEPAVVPMVIADEAPPAAVEIPPAPRPAASSVPRVSGDQYVWGPSGAAHVPVAAGAT